MEEPDLQIPTNLKMYTAKLIAVPKVEDYYGETSDLEDELVDSDYDRKNVYIKQRREKKSKKGGKYRTIPFIIYMVLSTIIIFGFLIRIIDPIETLVYFLIQSLYVIAIGTIIYWMCKNNSQIWSWLLLVISIVIQILWVMMAVYF